MQKLKLLKLEEVLLIIRCVLIGIASTLLGTVIFAVVLKFGNLSTKVISYVNQLIKIFSIFIMIMCVRRKTKEKFLFKAILSGAVYAVLSLIVFSIFNGEFVIAISFVYDLLFALVSSAIVAVIINLLNRKNV